MLKVKSYKIAAYEEIKEKIISGEFEPGKSLNERTLSEEFGISRTPIREALMKLSYEGWIINEPYKPNVVRNFDLKTILEAQKVRASLELLAIEESFNKINIDDIREIELITIDTESAKFTSLSLIPPLSIKPPDKINKGIAVKAILSTPVKSLCATTSKG